jgi:hypothetical protein
MIFTVSWGPGAVTDLAAIWLDAPDCPEVTSASREIDRLLRRDPAAIGESRDENVRIMFVAPLGVDFEVVEDDRIVYVLSVWRIEDPSQRAESG